MGQETFRTGLDVKRVAVQKSRPLCLNVPGLQGGGDDLERLPERAARFHGLSSYYPSPDVLESLAFAVGPNWSHVGRGLFERGLSTAGMLSNEQGLTLLCVSP